MIFLQKKIGLKNVLIRGEIVVIQQQQEEWFYKLTFNSLIMLEKYDVSLPLTVKEAYDIIKEHEKDLNNRKSMVVIQAACEVLDNPERVYPVLLRQMEALANSYPDKIFIDKDGNYEKF